MSSGDIKKEYDLMVQPGDVKAATAVAKGQVVVNKGSDFEPCSSGDGGDFAVALDAVTATATDRSTKLLWKGIVEVTCTTAVNYGDNVVADDAGKVKKTTIDTVAEVQSIVGTALETLAASGQLTIILD